MIWCHCCTNVQNESLRLIYRLFNFLACTKLPYSGDEHYYRKECQALLHINQDRSFWPVVSISFPMKIHLFLEVGQLTILRDRDNKMSLFPVNWGRWKGMKAAANSITNDGRLNSDLLIKKGRHPPLSFTKNPLCVFLFVLISIQMSYRVHLSTI